MSHDFDPNARIAVKGSARAFKVDFHGQPAWVKMPRAAQESLSSSFRNAVRARFMPPILRPTHIANGYQAIMFEAKRLRHLAAQGHNVPKILEIAVPDGAGQHGPCHLVLSDMGLSVWDIIKDGAGGTALARMTARALAGLHALGDYHGHPYPRNITYDGHNIGFIDFEDDAASVMPRIDAQLRDVWLITHGLWPFAKAGMCDVGNGMDIGTAVVQAYAASVAHDQLKALQALLPVMDGRHARAVHRRYGGRDRNENLARYAWAYQCVQKGLKRPGPY